MVLDGVRSRARSVARSVERGALRVVADTDPARLELLARRPARDLGRLVLVAVLPARFDAGRAGDLAATYELQLRHADGDGYDPITVRVSVGRCRVRPGPATAPDVTLRIRLDHLLRLVAGEVDVRAVLSDGRLTFTGDVLRFIRFPGLFGGLG